MAAWLLLAGVQARVPAVAYLPLPTAKVQNTRTSCLKHCVFSCRDAIEAGVQDGPPVILPMLGASMGRTTRAQNPRKNRGGRGRRRGEGGAKNNRN